MALPVAEELPVALPANLAGLAVVQMRMIAAIAHLRGYDVNDRRVRSALTLAMLGEDEVRKQVSSGRLASTPMGIATAPVFDARLDRQVSKALLDRSLNQMTGKRFGVWLGKRIPFVGGGVGAAVDGWSTRSIALHAMEEFPSRRPKLTRTVVETDKTD